MRKASGFTIVEILIVVGIIGILATVGFIGFGKYQSDTRDAERQAKATIISEALEKYFATNGEYPSCSAITGDPAVVVTEVLPGLEQKTLQAPQRPEGETNSIKCTDLTDPADGDYFAYVGGDTSTECAGVSGTACVTYTLKYIKEGTNDDPIQTIDSRHRAASGIAYLQSCNAGGFTQITCSWSPVSGASSYTLQAATDSGFTENVVTLNSISGTSAPITGLSYGTPYYLHVRTVVAGVASSWSDSAITSTLSLGVPGSVTVSASPSQLSLGWESVANATSYSIDYAANSDFIPVEGTGSSATANFTLSGLSTGTTKHFRVKAVNGAFSGNWSSPTSGTTNVPVPTGLSLTVNSTIQITASWNSIGSATSYDLDYSTSNSFSSVSTINTTSTSQAVTGLTDGTPYYFRVRAKIGSTPSANSSTASATTPSVVLGSPVTCAGTYSGRSAFQLRLTVDEVSYNLSANTSNVTWHIYRYAAQSGWASYDETKTWPWGISVDGQTSSGSSNSSFWRNNASVAGETETISSGTKTITHNSNGTKTISYSGYDGTSGNNSNIFGIGSCSGSYVLSDLR